MSIMPTDKVISGRKSEILSEASQIYGWGGMDRFDYKCPHSSLSDYKKVVQRD